MTMPYPNLTFLDLVEELLLRLDIIALRII